MAGMTTSTAPEGTPEMTVRLTSDRVGAPMPAPFGDAINLLAPAESNRRRPDCGTPEDERSLA